MSVDNRTMGVGLVVVILSIVNFILGLLSHQPVGSRVKRMSSGGDFQHLSIPIGIPMSEVILISIANIMASSSRCVTSTEPVVITIGISLDWSSISLPRDLIVVHL